MSVYASYAPLRKPRATLKQVTQAASAPSIQQLLGAIAPAKAYNPDTYLAQIRNPGVLSGAAPGSAAAQAGNLPVTVPHPSYALNSLGSQYGDYSSDPILQRIKAMQDANLYGARSTVQREQRSLLLNLGSPDLAKSVLGAKDPVLGLVSEDPEKSLSTFARIAHDYNQTVHSADEDLNSNNLFYSGYRGKQLADLARQETVSKNDATAQASDMLAGYGRELTAAEQQYQQAMLQAEEDAYMRAMQAAYAKAAAGGPTDPPGGPPPAGDPTLYASSTAPPGYYNEYGDALTSGWTVPTTPLPYDGWRVP